MTELNKKSHLICSFIGAISSALPSITLTDALVLGLTDMALLPRVFHGLFATIILAALMGAVIQRISTPDNKMVVGTIAGSLWGLVLWLTTELFSSASNTTIIGTVGSTVIFFILGFLISGFISFIAKSRSSLPKIAIFIALITSFITTVVPFLLLAVVPAGGSVP